MQRASPPAALHRNHNTERLLWCCKQALIISYMLIRTSYRLCVGSTEQRCHQCSCRTALQALMGTQSCAEKQRSAAGNFFRQLTAPCFLLQHPWKRTGVFPFALFRGTRRPDRHRNKHRCLCVTQRGTNPPPAPRGAAIARDSNRSDKSPAPPAGSLLGLRCSRFSPQGRSAVLRSEIRPVSRRCSGRSSPRTAQRGGGAERQRCPTAPSARTFRHVFLSDPV